MLLDRECVLDSSVALTWCLPGQANAASLAILKAVQKFGAIVPRIWHMEMANILGLKMRSGFLSASEVKDAVRLLQLPDIATDETTRHLQLPNLLGIVERYRLTTYDATYLDVAVREALPLATFDKEMIIAAKQYAVPIAGAI